MIFITHNPALLAGFADRVLVMYDGRIVEEGTHGALLQLGGLYAEMYRRQLLGEELEDTENGDLFPGR